MIKKIIVKKEKYGLYIVNDESYQIAFKTSDNKLFLGERNAIRHETKLKNENGSDVA